MATSKTAQSEFDSLKDDVDALRSDLRDIMSLIGDIGTKGKNGVSAAAKAQMDEASVKARHQAEVAAEYAANVRDQAADTGREKPGLDLGQAVGAGFLAGLVVGKK